MGRPAVAWRSAFACGWVIKVTSKLQNNVPPLGLDLDKKKMTMRRRRVVAGVFSFTITEKVFLSVWFMVFFFFFFCKISWVACQLVLGIIYWRHLCPALIFMKESAKRVCHGNGQGGSARTGTATDTIPFHSSSFRPTRNCYGWKM